MRSTRSKSLLVAAACAALLVPAGAATAASGPSPAPSGTAGSTAASPAGNPLSTAARAAGVCSDAVEIGERGLIERDGETLASVKQFYSKECNENYGYVWVWESFRNGAEPYDLTLGVYSYDDDTVDGRKLLRDTEEQEIWSVGADTVAHTTSGTGSLRPAGDPHTYQALSTREG